MFRPVCCLRLREEQFVPSTWIKINFLDKRTTIVEK